MATNTANDALIYELTARQQQHSGPPSINRVQQTAYLAQCCAKLPARFHFRMRYGSPSSDDVYDTLSNLQAAGYVSIRDHYLRHSMIRAAEITDAPNPDWQSLMGPVNDDLDRLMARIQDLTDRQLDALSCAHITKASMTARAGETRPTELDVIRTINNMKPRYTTEEIREACRLADEITSNEKTTTLTQTGA